MNPNYNPQFFHSVQPQGNYPYGPGGPISNTRNMIQSQQPNGLGPRPQPGYPHIVGQGPHNPYNSNTPNSSASQQQNQLHQPHQLHMYSEQQRPPIQPNMQYSTPVPYINQQEIRPTQPLPSKPQLNRNEFTAIKMEKTKVKVMEFDREEPLPHVERTMNYKYRQCLQRIPQDPIILGHTNYYTETLDKFFNDVPKDECFAFIYDYFMKSLEKANPNEKDAFYRMFNTIVNNYVRTNTLKFDKDLMAAINYATRAWDIMARVNSNLSCVYKEANEPHKVFLSRMYDAIRAYLAQALDKKTMYSFISRALFNVLYADSKITNENDTIAQNLKKYSEECINPVCEILSKLEKDDLKLTEDDITALNNLMDIFARINGIEYDKIGEESDSRLYGSPTIRIDQFKTQIGDAKPSIDPNYTQKYISEIKGDGDLLELGKPFKDYIEIRKSYTELGLPLLNDEFLLELIAISMPIKGEAVDFDEYKQGATQILDEQIKALKSIKEDYVLGAQLPEEETDTSNTKKQDPVEQTYKTLTKTIEIASNSSKDKKSIVQGYKYILEERIKHEAREKTLEAEKAQLQNEIAQLRAQLKEKETTIHAGHNRHGSKK